MSMDKLVTEDVRLREIAPLVIPREVKGAHPASLRGMQTALMGRQAVHDLLMETAEPTRLAVIMGPCSVHDPEAALEYADWLRRQRHVFGDELEIIMRVYFEKPRTTVGWKGLINDPGLDESFDINRGLVTARQLVRDITDMGIPVATELLDTMTPQYFADLLSWGAIGARTTESQLHRELASGLSFPVGFKNSTSGDTQVAIDAVSAAGRPHHFVAITNSGKVAIAKTSGNTDCHVVLRGGKAGPNFAADSVGAVSRQLAKAGLAQRVIVDASHDNSRKDHTKQMEVVTSLAQQITAGSTAVMGVMIESNLKEGRQPFVPGGQLEYGVSITDACVNLEDSAAMLAMLAHAVRR